jgi:nucleoside 2-deoxyribosyltransferase
MNDGTTKCYFCQNPVPPFGLHGDGSADVQCKVCGPYRILESAAREWYAWKWHDSGHILSGVIRNQNEDGINVTIGSLDNLGTSMAVPKGPLERIDRIVLHLLRKMDTYDATITLSPTYDYSITFSKDPKEFEFLVGKSMELGYVELPVGGAQYRLTIKGWQHASTLEAAKVKTRQAFVAMSFNPLLNSAYSEAIKPALEACGYSPLRVDRLEYNDHIDDQIIAGIRSSGLLIADFTFHRQSVYLELGFAMGLGTKVIRTCREDEIDKAHFDTRQYSHVVWANEIELRDRLIARINATVPLKS